MTAGARREDVLRLTGSAGANKLMEAELLRLVKRSPFRVRVPDPRRDGDATLLYPFEREIAWVACVYHRTASRVAWDLWSSPAERLEPLHEDLLPLVSGDDRLDLGASLKITVEVRAADDFAAGPLQLRGVVKNALVEGLRARGIAAEVDADDPDVTIAVRRGGATDARRTIVSLDLGGGARHRRAPRPKDAERGARVAMVEAPLRETLAAQLVLMSRWDARAEPLVDPMAGGGTIAIEAAHLATGHAARAPKDLVLARHPAFAGLPLDAPDLFTGTRPCILASDADQRAIAAMVGNLRASGLTGPEREDWIALKRLDVRDLTPEVVRDAQPTASLDRGVFCVNPPYGPRLLGAENEEAALLATYRDLGLAFGRFRGWRMAALVVHPGFVDAFGHAPRIVKPVSNASLRGWFLVFGG